jgi:hypothetical protein
MIVLASLVCSAMAGAQPPEPLGSSSQPDKRHARPPLKFSIKSDKPVYAPGDVITLTLTLTNPTKQPVPITFATGQKYDVLMGKLQPGKKWPAEGVWQSSLGMMYTQMVTTTTFAPRQAVTYQVKYPPDDGTTQPTLTAGEYCVKGTITSMGTGPKLDATTMFKVKAPRVR